jgi:hypothetical protein
VGEDRGDAGPDVLPFEDRDLADLDPGDVGDGVERTGGEDADDKPELAGPGTVLRGQNGGAENDKARPSATVTSMGSSLAGIASS